MSIQANVNALKIQFEHLFPGKWVTGKGHRRTLLTGVPEIDRSLSRGIARQRITEWLGSNSSGKTTLLRFVLSNWCANGFHVAYIDTEDRLLASDWAFVEQGQSGVTPLNTVHSSSVQPGSSAKFWVVRAHGALQNAFWAADQLLRCHEFDAVILDLGSSKIKLRTNRGDAIYIRLQKSLTQGNTALLIVREGAAEQEGWGSHARIHFNWGNSIDCQIGLGGIATILPALNCSVRKDGLAQELEVILNSHATNRLFTHPQVPDRRTSKT